VEVDAPQPGQIEEVLLEDDSEGRYHRECGIELAQTRDDLRVVGFSHGHQGKPVLDRVRLDGRRREALAAPFGPVGLCDDPDDLEPGRAEEGIERGDGELGLP